MTCWVLKSIWVMRKSPTSTSGRSLFSTEKTLRPLASNSPKEAAEVAPDGAQSRDAEAALGAEAAQSAAAGLAEPARAAQGAAAVAVSPGAPAGSFARRELLHGCVQPNGYQKTFGFVYCRSSCVHADGGGRSWLLSGGRRMLDRSNALD
jgi:hypothetical protein